MVVSDTRVGTNYIETRRLNMFQTKRLMTFRLKGLSALSNAYSATLCKRYWFSDLGIAAANQDHTGNHQSYKLTSRLMVRPNTLTMRHTRFRRYANFLP